MKASESPYQIIKTVPTGLPALDRITGIGGIPFRRITEISGPYSVGKSTLIFSIICKAQALGYRCVFADTEWSFEASYAASLGVDVNALGLIQERYAEMSLDVLEKSLEAQEYDCAFVDSIGALLPRQEAEKSGIEKVIGGQAGLVAKFCRKIVPILAINNQMLVVSNHQFVDIMSGRIKTSGGAKLEYHKALHISLRRANKRIMQGDRQIGAVIEAKIKKNKLAPTQEYDADLHLLFGKGFSVESDVLDEAIGRGIVSRKSNTFFFGTKKLGVGLGKVRQFLEEHPQTLTKIKSVLEQEV